MAETKICGLCDAEKPLSDFYLLGFRKTDNGPRYSSRCKACVIERSATSVRATGPRKLRPTRVELAAKAVAAAKAGVRTCRSCGKEKPVSAFYAKRTLVSGVVLYRADCRLCDAIKIDGDPVIKERIRKKTSDWRDSNPGAAKELSRTNNLRMRQKFPNRKMTRAERKAIDVDGIYASQNGRCPICSKPLDLIETELAHIVSVVNGGGNEPDNFWLLHSNCNKRQGKKDADTFMKFFVKKDSLI